MAVDTNKWFVIVNPVAGGGRGLDHFPQISKHLRDAHILCEPVFTEHKFHATELTVTAVKEGYRRIIVVGGDGTLHEVVNGLFIQQTVPPSEVLLAVVAVGTGIGGGLVVENRLVHGLVHPELGHMIMSVEPSDTMPDGTCPFHRHCLEGLASGPAIEKRWGLSSKLMTPDHPAWELEASYLAQMCVNSIVTFSPEVIVLGGGVMKQTHLFPRIRKKTLELLGGYVASSRLTPEGIDGYIVAPALGVNSCVVGALLLGAQALEEPGPR